ncbi:hypothetical protein M758_UG328700 [Ceratodon purpureus]|nr:hypothetical protein M758_UG328700 [Ceratodon purpureus]
MELDYWCLRLHCLLYFIAPSLHDFRIALQIPKQVNVHLSQIPFVGFLEYFQESQLHLHEHQLRMFRQVFPPSNQRRKKHDHTTWKEVMALIVYSPKQLNHQVQSLANLLGMKQLCERKKDLRCLFLLRTSTKITETPYNPTLKHLSNKIQQNLIKICCVKTHKLYSSS